MALTHNAIRGERQRLPTYFKIVCALGTAVRHFLTEVHFGSVSMHYGRETAQYFVNLKGEFTGSSMGILWIFFGAQQ